MTFTKGPWHVYAGGNFTKVAPEGYDERVKKEHYLGGAICDIDNWNGERHDPKASWVLHNANLIAAAPELYEALQRCAELLDDYSDVNDGEDGPRPNRAMSLLQDVEAALAKADGGK